MRAQTAEEVRQRVLSSRLELQVGVLEFSRAVNRTVIWSYKTVIWSYKTVILI